MRTSFSIRDLEVIARALHRYADAPSHELYTEDRRDEIEALAQHIEVIGMAAPIDANPTIIEVNK